MEEPTPSEKDELVKDVVGFDFNKLLKTFKELTVRPGATVAAYCDGARIKYVSPVTYFLLAYGINFFVTKLSGMMNYSFNGGTSASTNAIPGMGAFMEGIKMGNPNMTAEEFDEMTTLFGPSLGFMSSKEGMLIITLPVLIIMQWLFFRNFRKPFLQHVYFLLFVSAQINLLTLPLIIPFFFAPSTFWLITVASLIISVGIYLYAELKFYPQITFGDIVARTVGQVLTGFIPFIIWMFVVLISYSLIMKQFGA